MPPRSPTRFLAPGALVAVVVAVFLVVSGGMGGDPGAAPSAGTTTEAVATTKKSTRKRYTIRSNDNLSSIAERFGVTVDRLVELNPKIDPQTLRAGQRLRLR
jgi:LysM repeat protein